MGSFIDCLLDKIHYLKFEVDVKTGCVGLHGKYVLTVNIQQHSSQITTFINIFMAVNPTLQLNVI